MAPQAAGVRGGSDGQVSSVERRRRRRDEERDDEAALEEEARRIATSSPYNLDGDKLDVTVDMLDDSRVAGALEATISMEYDVPSVARMVGMGDIHLQYSRPVFLIS